MKEVNLDQPQAGQRTEINPQKGPTCGCGANAGRAVEQVSGDVAKRVPRVATSLTFSDHLGTWKARWGVGRMSYTVEPGLYAVGSATSQSPVYVSANYKMSFDRLRSNLRGRDGWILVLDTDGINVWCAAGKGTFGTEEIVNRLEAVGLRDIVSHRKLVVPQLGAPGISAHEVKRRTKFSVVYGPVRAEDLPAFMDADMHATPEMRMVKFRLRDRLVLIPMELAGWIVYVMAIAAVMFLLSGLGRDIFSLRRALAGGGVNAALFIGAFLAGAIGVPALLPYLPGRLFSIKGALVGLLFALAVSWIAPGIFDGRLSTAAWFLLAPAIASFVGMNFTGASTYTSLSGVLRETRTAIPVQIACAAIGLGLWLIARFV